MRKSLFVMIVLAAAACSADREPVGPVLETDRPGRNLTRQVLLQEFVVLVDSDVDPVTVAQDHGLEPAFVYNTAFKGFSGSMSELARSGLLRDARVRRVEPSQDLFIDDGVTPAASWGLDRIDQRSSALDGMYSYNATGQGVTVYIVDTGIRYTHDEFGGRASFGFDAFGEDGADCQGHGTHVAGTVGGTTYGVAKAVDLVSVRVLGCTGGGTTSTVAAGLDWILQNGVRPAVVNMSLGGGGDDIVDEAVRQLVAAGIPVAVSAGNNDINACFKSPARVAEAMTVGATDWTDTRASYWNYGECVDWYAPGSSIVSAGNGSDEASATKSGTSMAAPHTAGAAALFLEGNPGASAPTVAAALAAQATRNVVTTSVKGGKRDLPYSLGEGSTGNALPVASFTATCTDLQCAFTDGSTDADGTLTAWQWDFGDGTSSTDPNPTHTYAAAGTYSVSLTVTDDAGAIATTSKSIQAGTSTPGNAPPVALFTASCSRLACTFTDASSDSDGTVVQWEWDYGDGNSALVAASADQAHTFLEGGTYTVNLTVRDDDGDSSSSQQSVEVGIQLAVAGYRVKGRHSFDLTWQGAETSRVDIIINGIHSTTVDAAGGSFTFPTDNHGQGTYDFRVCEEGSSYCSGAVTVVF